MVGRDRHIDTGSDFRVVGSSYCSFRLQWVECDVPPLHLLQKHGLSPTRHVFVSGEIVLRHRARCAMSREPSPRAEPPGRGAADEGVDAAADDDMTMATAASTRTTRTT